MEIDKIIPRLLFGLTFAVLWCQTIDADGRVLPAGGGFVFLGGDLSSFPKALPPRHVREPLIAGAAEVAQANNRFAFDMLKDLRQRSEPDKSLLFSPFSASAALSMTMAGAVGRTAQQMQSALGYGDQASALIHPGMGGLINDLNQPRDGYELRVANRLFGQQGRDFKTPFLNTMEETYHAPLEELDFIRSSEESRQQINKWVADQTNDRIQNLLPKGSVDKRTRLVLTNALYFDGKWKYEFHESATREEPFQHLDNSMSMVSMMHQSRRFRYGDFDDYQMLEMPYAGDDLSMVILLPDEADGLGELEESLDAASFQASVDSLSNQKVTLSLPKFNFEGSLSLSKSLQELGMRDPFSTEADFSAMSDEPLQLDKVVQKTFIEVDESGTEAAAATAVGIITNSDYTPYVPPVEFTVDHSFLYAIRDAHSGALLFLGRMTEPTVVEAAPLVGVPEPAGVVLVLIASGLNCLRRRSYPG